jgi:hypothetical protein
MSNNLHVHRISIKGCHERMFIPFFEIDCDFSENEEYYREDTLALGFKSEAERCSKELYDRYFAIKIDFKTFGDRMYLKRLSGALEDGASISNNGSQFILGNQTYTSDYEISIVSKGNYEYEIIVSRLSY